MTRKLSVIALLLGLIIIVWMGASFMDSNLLAFIVICMIAAVFITGFMELHRYQRDSGVLNDALLSAKEPVTDLDAWLAKLPVGLINSVRLRVQGERVLLPAPILSPYLIGLLVMLGLLGTFAGMVDTLKGAVAALQGTAELEAIRAGLVAPISGLGLAFGTSVAGISASALLGFIATLSRRQRAEVVQLLDGKTHAIFKHFSLAYHREQTFQMVQQQSEAFPLVAEKLITVAEHLEQLGSTMSEQLLTNQATFHSEVGETYASLAQSVGQSLQQSLKDSGYQVANSIEPLMVDLAKNIEQGMENTHQQLTGHMTSAFDQLRADIQKASQTVATDFSDASGQWIAHQQEQDQQRLQQWHSALEQSSAHLQQRTEALAESTETRTQHLLSQLESLLQSTESIVSTRIANEDQWLIKYEQRMEVLNNTLSEQLVTLRKEESERAKAAVDQLQALQADVGKHLQTLGCALEAPMTRLIETASETPRAAAEVISELRAELSNTVERDNQLLEERQQVFERLQLLADNLQQSSIDQNNVLTTLVNQTSESLNHVREEFMTQIDTESARLNEAVDHVTGSAIELSSLGDAFTVAVEQFGQSNREVMEVLTLVEASLLSSSQRSDEQMAYYVAQAREIIDHTVLSQQEMIEQLRHLGQPTETVVNA